MQSLALTALAALLLGAAPAPEAKPADKDPTKPVLIVKHKDYLIHAIPQLASGERKLLADDRHPPLLLVYTSVNSGEMKRLAEGGHSAVPGPPMGIDRIHNTRTRIVGVAADAERLYVAYHTATWRVKVQAGGGQDGPEQSKYELLVFRLSDGEKLHTMEMKEGDFPDKAPADSAEPGPLKVMDGSVTCYGVAFAFKGKDGTQRYDKKKD